MLMALALLAAINAVPSSTVSLTLTGGADRAPVSAAPRSLSDVARELREGRQAVGGFSAVESTVSQSKSVFIPAFEPEPVTRAPEPEPVIEAPPTYAPTYLPYGYGGPRKSVRLHQRPAAHVAVPRAASPLPDRSFQRPAFQPLHGIAGHLRQR